MALTNCVYKIDSDSTLDCSKEQLPGIVELAILNADDLVSISQTTPAPATYNEFDTVTKKQGAKAWVFKDARTTAQYDGSTVATASGSVFNRALKTIQFLYYGTGAAASRTVDAFNRGSFVIFAKKRDTDSTRHNIVEIFGAIQPCVCTYTRTLSNNDESSNCYLITATTTESVDGYFLWDTSVTQTLADYEALKA